MITAQAECSVEQNELEVLLGNSLAGSHHLFSRSLGTAIYSQLSDMI